MAPDTPPLDRAAFLLDLDGTLLDIAPTPGEVVVAPGLAEDLLALRGMCGNALAFVTGRPIAQVDALFPHIPWAVAGEHGTAIRHAPDAGIETIALPHAPAAWIAAARLLAKSAPGALFEPKQHGFVLHYRGAPQDGPRLEHALRAMLEQAPGQFALLAAKMAWEIRPSGVDKGTAVRRLMERAPFAGRLPVFVGDDVTDEDGMREAAAQGGMGLLVPDVFGDAAGVRAWITALSRTALAG
jgi:trehalose 6-phosphate phosphatase